MAYENILVETRGAVGLIDRHRPEALTALGADLIGELGSALASFEADDAVGAYAITGSEKAFAAGAAIKEMRSESVIDVFAEGFITSGWERIATCRKPSLLRLRAAHLAALVKLY